MTIRRTANPVDPLFLERWSPRAFDGSPVPQQDLETMLDAARWAPSAFNSQPWRFLYAHHGDMHWDRFVDVLVPFNREWAKHAAVLVFILSDTLPFKTKAGDPAPSLTHSFDAGAAWALLALQAWRMGYFAHGMSGIDLDHARTELGVPERYTINAAAAIGRQGDPTSLPEKLRAREAPSDRNPVSDFAFHGLFPG